MAFISEADVEALVLRQLDDLGFAISSDAEIGPDGKSPEREAYADVILAKRLISAIERLNPSTPAEARGDAVRKVLATEMPGLVAENRRLHKLMVEGVNVEFRGEDGNIRGDKVRLIDFHDLNANDWLATGQFTVINGSVNRRPDIVVFVNGLASVALISRGSINQGNNADPGESEHRSCLDIVCRAQQSQCSDAYPPLYPADKRLLKEG